MGGRRSAGAEGSLQGPEQLKGDEDDDGGTIMGPKTGKRRGQRKLWAVTITVYVRHRSGSAAEDHVQSHLDPSPDGCSLIEGTNARLCT